MAHYGTLGDALSYLVARGRSEWLAVDVTDEQRTSALLRGSDAVDVLFSGRWPGRKAGGRGQEREWPRIGAIDNDGNEIAADEVPAEVERATYEAALRELTEPGSMLPDLERGGAVKRLKAGSVEVEYNDDSPATTTFSVIDGILVRLLISAPGGTQVTMLMRA